jgi:hypothetical protein
MLTRHKRKYVIIARVWHPFFLRAIRLLNAAETYHKGQLGIAPQTALTGLHLNQQPLARDLIESNQVNAVLLRHCHTPASLQYGRSRYMLTDQTSHCVGEVA